MFSAKINVKYYILVYNFTKDYYEILKYNGVYIMLNNERECIEYALHAYDTFWDYYKKTLDERNQILNNYMVFVGIPISILMINNDVTGKIDLYSKCNILPLTIILILGIVIYDVYIVESIISEKYLEQIRNITKYLISNYNNSYRDVFERTYVLDNLFLDETTSWNHRLGKCFIIITINTGIIFSILLIIIKWYSLILTIIISSFLHISIFFYRKRK